MPQRAHPQPFRLRLLPLLVGSLVLLSACAKQDGQQAPAMGPLPVSVVTVQPQSVPNAIEVMAQTEGAKETAVLARVSGILVKQFYQEGQLVKAGQPLFQIDRAAYEYAFEQAKATADQTEREMQRAKKLIDVQGISRKEYDDAVSANELAQAQLRSAQLNLSWTTVTAPLDGVSGRAAKSVGNYIAAGSTDSQLTSIYQTDPIWVRFSLSESETAKLPDGHLTPQNVTGVELTLPNGSTYPEKGKLNFLASSIDLTLGTQQLRAEFANKDNRLLPGQFVRVRLLSGQRDGVYLVPQSAVIQTEQGNLVMVADAGNKVAPRPVQTGDWYGTNWVILGGLNPGDKVIVDNLMKLKPGIPVAPHAPGVQPGAPTASPTQPDKAATAPNKDGAPAANATTAKSEPAKQG
jgi:membrane fusion protein, multidrug efflux system